MRRPRGRKRHGLSTQGPPAKRHSESITPVTADTALDAVLGNCDLVGLIARLLDLRGCHAAMQCSRLWLRIARDALDAKALFTPAPTRRGSFGSSRPAAIRPTASGVELPTESFGGLCGPTYQ